MAYLADDLDLDDFSFSDSSEKTSEKSAEKVAEAPTKQRRKRRKRAVIFRNEDGSIDTSKLDDDGREILAQLQAEKPEEINALPTEVGATLLTVFGALETQIVAKKTGLAVEQVRPCFVPAPPIAEKMSEAVTKVLNKYAGGLTRFADEIALACLIIVWQTSAFAQVNDIREAQAKGEQ
jgi:hypothetical protein